MGDFSIITIIRADFLDEGKVVVGRDDGDMPHIDGQQRKLSLNVAAVEIAASEHLDGEGMPQVVNARRFTFVRKDLEGFAERAPIMGKTCSRVASVAAVPVPDQSGAVLHGKPLLASQGQIDPKLRANVGRERNEPSFMELGRPDQLDS